MDIFLETAQPLVSVIIPVYNTAQYLRQCVDSVLAQTYRNLEVILIDDGSADGSGDICDEYAGEDARIRVLHQKNGGLSVARNNGLEVAQGEYVQFADSDDWMDTECISDCVRVCQSGGYDMVTFDTDEVAEIEVSDHVALHKCKKAYAPNTGMAMFKEIMNNDDLNVSAFLYLVRKSILDENNITFPPGIIHEDYSFTFFTLLHATRVVHIHKEYYFRRVRSDSIMTTPRSSKNAIGLLESIRLIAPYLCYTRYSGIRRAIKKYVWFLLGHLLEVCLQIKEFDDFLPAAYKIAEENHLLTGYSTASHIIWYGYGYRSKLLLSNSTLPKPNEIWDKNAELCDNYLVKAPNYDGFMHKKDTLFIICVDNYDICKQIREQAELAGFINVTDWRNYMLRYYSTAKENGEPSSLLIPLTNPAR